MIDDREMDRYRTMSIEDRLREFEQLMEVAFAVLDSLPPDERRRRWEMWAHEDEEAAERLARRLASQPR